MNANIEIPNNLLTDALSNSLFKGELGEKLANKLADRYAEITTYNRTDAAKLLNVARSTLYGYESDGLITFRADGRTSLANLLNLQRKLSELDEGDFEVIRKEKQEKRRVKK